MDIGLKPSYFSSPAEAMEEIRTKGFDWRLVREYFQFNDSWLSERQYSQMLNLSLASINCAEKKIILLDMLDLQYTVFLAQVYLQEKILNSGENSRTEFIREGDNFFVVDESISIAFSDRVGNYLLINEEARIHNKELSKGAASTYGMIGPDHLAEYMRKGYSQYTLVPTNLNKLPPIQIKAVVEIVLLHQDFKDGRRNEVVTTDEISDYLKVDHKETMKAIRGLKKLGLLTVRQRMSGGLTGHGYDGALYGELLPSGHCIRLVRDYLKLP
jgi:hypothetical protein